MSINKDITLYYKPWKHFNCQSSIFRTTWWARN